MRSKRFTATIFEIFVFCNFLHCQSLEFVKNGTTLVPTYSDWHLYQPVEEPLKGPDDCIWQLLATAHTLLRDDLTCVVDLHIRYLVPFHHTAVRRRWSVCCVRCHRESWMNHKNIWKNNNIQLSIKSKTLKTLYFGHVRKHWEWGLDNRNEMWIGQVYNGASVVQSR